MRCLKADFPQGSNFTSCCRHLNAIQNFLPKLSKFPLPRPLAESWDQSVSRGMMMFCVRVHSSLSSICPSLKMGSKLGQTMNLEQNLIARTPKPSTPFKKNMKKMIFFSDCLGPGDACLQYDVSNQVSFVFGTTHEVQGLVLLPQTKTQTSTEQEGWGLWKQNHWPRVWFLFYSNIISLKKRWDITCLKSTTKHERTLIGVFVL